jgi:hypothetical protein
MIQARARLVGIEGMQRNGKTPRLIAAVAILGLIFFLGGCGSSSSGGGTPPPPPPPPPASNNPFWAQWGSTSQHTGLAPVAAQSLNTKLADIVYDPFVSQEQDAEFGELVDHYQATLTDGNDFYMESKSGTYPACSPAQDWTNGTICGPNAWNQLVWNVSRYTWESGQPVLIWTFQTDWKPEPNATDGLDGWEPVFHPVLANSYIYVPGAGGTIWKVDKDTGDSVSHIDPLSGAGVQVANTFVSGPLTADANGNVYYNVMWLADQTVTDPWFSSDVLGAWLVKATPADTASSASYASLVPGAPPASASTCPSTFYSASPLPAFPWPPSPTAVAPTVACGSQRPGVNIAPAVATDGTIYTVSRAHFDPMASYMVAVNPDLTPKWQTSMQLLLHDGCGVLLPIAGNSTTPNSCSAGTTVGVDPTTNAPGSGVVYDLASSTPTVLPDGSILFGALDRYNFSRGHLFKFDSGGNFLGAYGFGWDSTPAVYPHDGTYSIVIKDNHYAAPAYCSRNSPVCTAVSSGPYYISQLDANLNVEWQFQNTGDSSHPNGYEWCVNAPAIDSNGTVYVNSEDGNVYSIPQGNAGVFTAPQGKIFLKQAIGAAYTPLSVGPDGKLYVQNDGHLFIVGN